MSIELVNVTKEFKVFGGSIAAISDLSLVINKGERVGVLGRNGSGKSTLISLVGGVMLPTRGKIISNMTTSWPLGFRGGLHSNLSGYENLRFLSRVYNRSFEELVDKVQEFSELGRRLRDPFYTYSSGMRAKLSFAISLAIEFDCYLIDEIVAVGDRRLRMKCREEFLQKRADRAMLMVSHQARAIREYCTTGVLLEKGRYVDRFDIRRDRNWRKYIASA